MGNFKEVKEYIKSKLKGGVVLDNWTFIPQVITEETENRIRIQCEFSTKDYTEIHELKFVDEHFDDFDKYDIEINRLLNRYDGFSDCLDKIELIAKSNEGKPLSDEGAWKGVILHLERVSPVEAITTFIFSKTDDNNQLLSFTKDFKISQASFISFENYLLELDNILTALNNINSTPTEYYETAIKTTTY